jgi:hypothetical protein
VKGTLPSPPQSAIAKKSSLAKIAYPQKEANMTAFQPERGSLVVVSVLMMGMMRFESKKRPLVF